MSSSNGQEEPLQPTPADEWRRDARRNVRLPSGHVATIRALTQRDLISVALVTAVLSPEMEQADEGARQRRLMEYYRAHPDELFDYENALLRKGCVHPRIFVGPEADCPPDMLHVLDLGADRDALLRAIQQVSGMTEAAGAAVESFREPTGTGGSAPSAG